MPACRFVAYEASTAMGIPGLVSAGLGVSVYAQGNWPGSSRARS